MKKLLLVSLVAAAIGASTSALAQVAGPTGLAPQAPAKAKGDKLGRKEMERLNEEILAKLNLTDDQRAKLKAHREEMAGKLKDLRKGGDKEAAKEKMKAMRKENQEFVKGVLTKDQMREMQRLRREAVREMQAKRDAPGKP